MTRRYKKRAPRPPTPGRLIDQRQTRRPKTAQYIDVEGKMRRGLSEPEIERLIGHIQALRAGSKTGLRPYPRVYVMYG